MTFWDKVLNQNKIDSSLISELSDLSFKSIGGKRQAPRGAKEDIVNIGTIPFEATPAPDKITKEMILEYQKNKDKPYIDPITNTEYKYNPTGLVFDVADLKVPVFINDATLGRPATKADITNLQNDLSRLVRALNRNENALERNLAKEIDLTDKINSGNFRTTALGKLRAQLVSVKADITKN